MNVLIIDDHALIREGIALMVQEAKRDAHVWQAASYAEGMEIAAGQEIDFAFLDLQLPDESGFKALELLKRQRETMRTVVVSALDDRDSIMRAIDMGATAYVTKSANAERMRRVIQDLFDGRVCLPESVVGAHAEHSRKRDDRDEWNLTERQREVLALMVIGLPNKIIARRLNIVESTVKIHVSAILRELKVASRTQALLAVARSGAKLPLH